MEDIQVSKRTGEQGFSLIELAFSTLIFLMVTGSLYGLLELGRADRNRTNRQSDSNKNARLATYLISRDLMNAGLGYHKTGAFIPDGGLNQRFRVPLDTGGVRDVLTSVSVGNDVDTNVLDPSRPNDVLSIIYRNLDANGGTPINVVNEVSTNQNQIVLQTVAGGAATVNVHDVFIAENDITQVLVMVTAVDPSNNRITFAYGDPLNLNQIRSGNANNLFNSLLRKCASSTDVGCTSYPSSALTSVRLKRVVWMSYQVDSTGTLTRTTYGNNTGATASKQIVVQPLIFNVRSLQFEYGMKSGVVSNDPAAGADGVRGNTDDIQYEMNLIRQVTVNLEIEASAKDEKSGAKQYVKLSTTFSTRNLQYDDR